MKKLFAMAAALLISAGAHAQFEQGKLYMNASLTGLNMSYNGSEGFNFGVQGQLGYMVANDWLVYGLVDYSHKGKGDNANQYSVGVGGRYYIEQNGLYLGAQCKLAHASHYTDVMPGIEVGYAYFLSRTVTIEPAIYYNQSFKNHSDFSSVGLKVSIGVYLFND